MKNTARISGRYFYCFCLPYYLQGAGRADLGAGLAGKALLYGLGIVELRLDDRVETSSHKTQQPCSYLLVADTHAEVAAYALALVALYADELLLLEVRVLFALEALRLKIRLPLGELYEIAVAVLVAAALKAP